MEDSILIKRCRRGDRDAFNELVEKYQTRVVNIAYGMLSDTEDAYDAAQEVFINIYRSIGSFREQSSFTTWLYRITANVCADILRKRQKSLGEISIDAPIGDDNSTMDITDTSHSPETAVFENERQRIVAESMKKLPEDYRQVIHLYDIENLSYKEIAELLNISQGTVKSRIFRGRKLLREILTEYKDIFMSD